MGYFANYYDTPAAATGSTESIHPNTKAVANSAISAPAVSPDIDDIELYLNTQKTLDQTRRALDRDSPAYPRSITQSDRHKQTEERYAIYARVSSKLSNQKSPDDQVAECRAVIYERGTEVPDDRVYIDRNWPGRYFKKRPELQRLIEDARRGLFDTLMVDIASRLGRVISQVMGMYERLTLYGVKIEARGMMMMSMMAQFDNREKSTATRRGLKKRAARGAGFTGGKPPYGYQFGPRDEDGKLTIVRDKNTAPFLLCCFQQVAAGRNFGAIASILNRAGIPAPAGGIWKYSTLWNAAYPNLGILRNVKYIGWAYNGKAFNQFNGDREAFERRERPVNNWTVVKGTHEGTISRELFFAVQKKLDALTEENAKAGAKGSRERQPRRLLSSRIRCPSCGGRLWIAGATAAGKPRIQCPNSISKLGIAATCINKRTFCLETIERAAIELVCEVLSQPRYMKIYIDNFQREMKNATKSLRSQRGDILAKRDEVQNALGRLSEAWEKQLLSETLVKSRSDAYEHELARLNNLLVTMHEVAPITIDMPSIAKLRQTMLRLASAYKEMANTADGLLLAADFQELVAAVVPIAEPAQRTIKLEIYGRIALLTGQPNAQDPVVAECKSTAATRTRGIHKLTLESAEISHGNVCFVAEATVIPGQPRLVNDPLVIGLVSLYAGHHPNSKECAAPGPKGTIAVQALDRQLSAVARGKR
jgi:DNA invertase Pin-like site-specific DNA recombinase